MRVVLVLPHSRRSSNALTWNPYSIIASFEDPWFSTNFPPRMAVFVDVEWKGQRLAIQNCLSARFGFCSWEEECLNGEIHFPIKGIQIALGCKRNVVNCWRVYSKMVLKGKRILSRCQCVGDELPFAEEFCTFDCISPIEGVEHM